MNALSETFSTEQLPFIPARMVNEFVYCPRLAYLEWVQGEFVHNEYTVDGKIKHRRVDNKTGRLPPKDEKPDTIHARSVDLSSEVLGVTAKIDLVEGDAGQVVPVDYKRGKRPHVPGGAHAPERVQLCVQGLLLRETGYVSDYGVIYFVGSRERVKVVFDEPLVTETKEAIAGLRRAAVEGMIPPPLDDSPKCLKCSLAGICLPDELRFLNSPVAEPRPIYPRVEKGLPFYVQSHRAYVRKEGERFIVEEEQEKVAEARIGEVSQISLFGNASLSSPVIHECFRREIPISFLSYNGWFMGHAVGTGHRNVDTRTCQYRASFNPTICLSLARGWVAAKVSNCRTLVRRNWRGDGDKAPDALMIDMLADSQSAEKAGSIESLLGVEGAAANRYFSSFSSLLRSEPDPTMEFDFSGRNRRPPKDPVNAMLSFAYAMLVREWSVVLSAVGLDPFRGFYHQPRFGRPALALDMMEPFRPLIADSTVLTAINNGEVRPEDFIRAAGGCTMKENGRKKFIAGFERRMGHEVTHPVFGYKVSYRRLLEVQSRLLARFLTGEIEQYPNFMTR
jgi:CRISP-associated protein Cas1